MNQDTLFITPVLTLNQIGEQLNTREVSLYRSDGQLIAYSSQETSIFSPNHRNYDCSSKSVKNQLRRRGNQSRFEQRLSDYPYHAAGHRHPEQ